MLYQKCRPASKRELTRLAPLIDQVVLTCNYKPVRLFVAEEDEINGFALGKGNICLSRGALEKLDDGELYNFSVCCPLILGG